MYVSTTAICGCTMDIEGSAWSYGCCDTPEVEVERVEITKACESHGG